RHRRQRQLKKQLSQRFCPQKFFIIISVSRLAALLFLYFVLFLLRLSHILLLPPCDVLLVLYYSFFLNRFQRNIITSYFPKSSHLTQIRSRYYLNFISVYIQNRYPTPHTVCICRGTDGSSSILSLSLLT